MKLKLIFSSLLIITAIATASAQEEHISLKGIKRFELHGFAQTNYDYTKSRSTESNDFNFKHIVLIGEASVTDKLSFRLMTDMASPKDLYLLLQEYYAQYEIYPWLKIRLGQFKVPYSIENVMPPTLIGALNMNESVRYMAGVVGDPLYGLMAGRDQGLMLTGDLLKDRNGRARANYSIGLFNGAGVNQRDNNNAKDIVVSLNLMPDDAIQISFTGIRGTGNARTDSPFGNILQGEDYKRHRWSVGIKAHHGRINLRSEFLGGHDGSTTLRGGYAEVWIRTIPKLDIVGIIDYLDRNTDLSHQQQKAISQATETTNYTIGLQYWIYRNCRLATQYVYTDSPSTPVSHLWATQMQIAF